MSPAQMKFFFVFAIPGIILLLSVIGANRWTGYQPLATLMIVCGAFCAGSLVRRSRPSTRSFTGAFYGLVMEIVMFALI